MPHKSKTNKKYAIGGILVLCLALLWGCAASPACSSTREQPSELTLLFQKTPCLGICPAYDARFYEDGSITFIGYRNVPVQDTLQFCLSEEELQSLQKAREALNFSTLQSTYLSQWSDTPATYLTFYEDGKEVKRVKHQEGGPQDLLLYQEMLHQLVIQHLKEVVEEVE